jgi:hypothetical protein
MDEIHSMYNYIHISNAVVRSKDSHTTNDNMHNFDYFG